MLWLRLAVRWPTGALCHTEFVTWVNFILCFFTIIAMSAEQELCESDLLELANLLSADTWKDFGRSLGLRNGELRDIEVKHSTEQPKELRLQMLLLWFQRCPTGNHRWRALKQAAEDNRIMKMVEHINSKQGMSWWDGVLTYNGDVCQRLYSIMVTMLVHVSGCVFILQCMGI